MKTIKKSILWLFCLALAATISFTACTDDKIDNPVNGNGNGQTEETPITVFDDLAYFQNAIIPVDEEGNMICRIYGEILRDSDPENLYIGVEDLTEAESIFRRWIAPDIELSTTIPTAAGLTCPLTDMDGNPQGTIYFTPGSGNIVAEVTASSDTQLKFFNKITFQLNSTWPFNVSIYRKYTEGDIITYAPRGNITKGLNKQDWVLNWVCIRQGGLGVKPMFCAITNNKYQGAPLGSTGVSDYCIDYWDIVGTNYTPGGAKAQTIANILKNSWNYFVKIFDKAGCGKLQGDMGYWIKESHSSWMIYQFVDYIYYSSGTTYGASASDQKKLPFLFAIDWLDDEAITTSLSATDGSDCIGDDETYRSLFDGQTNTKWCSHVVQRKDGVWFVDFRTNAPVIPTSYKMTTANDCQKFNNRNPMSWKLYGRADLSEDWTLLSEINNGGMADINCRTYTYPIRTPDYYMYFRLEISSVPGNEVMMLSEFNLSIQGTDDIDRVLVATAGTQRSDGQDQYINLFSKNSEYYWYCPSNFKQNGLWFVEFNSLEPGTPVGYKLYSSCLSQTDYQRHPKNWKLYGKLNAGDEWTLIDERIGQDLPHSIYNAKSYTIANPAKYQYYRYEVSAVNGASELILGGFEFVYDD